MNTHRLLRNSSGMARDCNSTFDDGFSIFRDVEKERQRENVSRCKEIYRKRFHEKLFETVRV